MEDSYRIVFPSGWSSRSAGVHPEDVGGVPIIGTQAGSMPKY